MHVVELSFSKKSRIPYPHKDGAQGLCFYVTILKKVKERI